jgi:hypothetical protein
MRLPVAEANGAALMGHYLNFGAGPNELPAPWQNLNVSDDIRKPLRFESGSASCILAEHVIEHVPFEAGFLFLVECRRVLELGGVLRVCFPDVGRFLETNGPAWRIRVDAEHYARELWNWKQSSGEDVPRLDAPAELLRLVAGWGHRCAWTERSMAGVLLAIGFSDVRSRPYGSALGGAAAGVDGHHLSVGLAAALLETTILEATK